MIKTLSFLFLSALFFFAVPASFAENNTIRVVTETWPPFRIPDEANNSRYTGIDVDLLELISRQLGMSVQIRRYPWARCLALMKDGEADLITGLAYTPERAETIEYVKPAYFRVSPAFYLQKGHGPKVMAYEDLKAFTIGYSISSAYFEPFNSDTSLKKHGVSTERQLILMLASGRLNIIIGTDSNVEYDIARMGLKDKIEKAWYRPDKKTDLFIGISKKSDLMSRHADLCRMITELINSGRIRTITEKYF